MKKKMKFPDGSVREIDDADVAVARSLGAVDFTEPAPAQKNGKKVLMQFSNGQTKEVDSVDVAVAESLGAVKKKETSEIGAPTTLPAGVSPYGVTQGSLSVTDVSRAPQAQALVDLDVQTLNKVRDKRLINYISDEFTRNQNSEVLNSLNLNDDKSISRAISLLEQPKKTQRDEKGYVTETVSPELEKSKADASMLLKQRLMFNKSKQDLDNDIKIIEPTIKKAVTSANMRRERGENIPTEKLFGEGVDVDAQAADHFAAGLNYLKDANPAKFNNITRALAEKEQIADTDFEQVAEIGKLIRQYQGQETDANYMGSSYQSKKADYARQIGEWLKKEGVKGGEFADVSIDRAAKALGLNNKEILQDLKFEEKLIGYDAIPKSGGVEAFVRGVATPIAGITNSLERWFNESDSDTYLKSQAFDVGIGQKVTDEKGQPTGELPSERGNIWYDALEGFGQFIPQVALTRGIGGVAARGVGAAIPSAVSTASKANNLVNVLGTLPSVYLQEYGNAYQDALNKTGNPNEARAMGFINAAAASGFELFLPDAKIAQKAAGIFKAKYAEDLVDLIRKAKKTGDISDLSAKGRSVIGKFVTEVGAITGQEINEELATNITNYLTETIFSPETAKERDLGSELLETAKATAVQMIIPALLGGGGGVNRDFTKNGLHSAAINLDEYKKSLNRALIEGQISDAENNDAIRILETHRRNIHTSPELDNNDKPIPQDKRMEFAFQQTNIDILNKKAESVTSDVQKEVIENKIKKAQDIQREIIGTEVTEEREGDTFKVEVEDTTQPQTRVVDEERLSSDDEIITFQKVQTSGKKSFTDLFIDPTKPKSSMDALKAQAVDAPNGLLASLNEDTDTLTDIIALNDEAAINAGIQKWTDAIADDTATPEEADAHISLLEEGLAKKKAGPLNPVTAAKEQKVATQDVSGKSGEVLYRGSKFDLAEGDAKPVFFSPTKEYAEKYGDTKEYSVDIKNAFDTSNEEARRIYNEEFLPFALEKSKGDKRYEPLKEGEKVPFTTADLLYVFLRKNKREGKDYGYDGVVVDERIDGEYSKFPLSKSQIKEVQQQAPKEQLPASTETKSKEEKVSKIRGLKVAEEPAEEVKPAPKKSAPTKQKAKKEKPVAEERQLADDVKTEEQVLQEFAEEGDGDAVFIIPPGEYQVEFFAKKEEPGAPIEYFVQVGRKDPDIFDNYQDALDHFDLVIDELAKKQKPDLGEELTGDEDFDYERKEPEEIFPEPTETKNFSTELKKEIPQEEADDIVQSWKDFAKQVGKNEDHSDEVIISLFDDSGGWSKPYEEAGYTVVRYDLNRGDDIVQEDWNQLRARLEKNGKKVVGVLSAPPCTSFAGSGARWWGSQHDVVSKEWVERKYGSHAAEYADSPLEYAIDLVNHVMLAVEFLNPSLFHTIENPVGRIQEKAELPDPTLAFHPSNFGDPYTKKTFIWGVMNTDLPTANVHPAEGSKMQSQLTGFTKEGKRQRSITPEGFAYAFFMANNTSKLKAGAKVPEVAKAPAKAEPVKTEPKPAKEVARKIRDEKARKEIDGLWDEFMKGDNLLTSGGLDPKKIEVGTKLVGAYIKQGVYKFADILEDAYAKFGDKLNDWIDALKSVYSTYYNTEATDQEAELMDASVRNIQLKDIIKTQSDDRGTKIVDEPQVVPSTTPMVKGEPQEVIRPDDTRGKEQVDVRKSRDSDKTERVAGEQEDADRPGGRDSEGEHDVALNGNDKLNEELGGTSEKQPIPKPKEQSPIVTPLQHNGNFIIPPDFVNTKTFNVGQKLQDNIDALNVLITLNKEDRKPTYEEQKTLFKYVGWGGIKEIGFDPNSDAGWTGSNISLKPKIKEVLNLIKELDPTNQAKNISAIKSSVLNAHYTAVPVIRGIWDVLRKGGFKGGNVLEPSAGTGNFIGAMPIDFIEKSKIIGVELDFVTSQVLKNLYPNHITKNYGYEEAPIGEGNADLVISNIPFGNYAVHDPNFLKSKDPVLKKATKKIHSYFFARAIRDVKPNGHIAFVTTTGILDSKDNRELREMIAERTEFLGAIRLPNDSFKGNANTSVTTDIIFLRKFGESEQPKQRHDFLDVAAKSVKHKDRDETFKVFYNEYFHDNPEMILGEVRAGSMYGASKDNLTDAMTVVPTGINIEEGIVKLGSKIFPKETVQTKTDTIKESANSFIKDNGERIGNIVEVSPGVYGVIGDVIENPETGERSRQVNTIRFAKKYQEAVKDLIPLRTALNELYAAEYGDMGEDLINSKRAELNKAYKTFVKNNGTLIENRPLLEVDTDGHNMLALEKVEGKKVVGLADIFTKRVFRPRQRVERAGSVADAIVINLNETGEVDINRVAELLDVTPEEAIKQTKGVLFKNPEGGFETKDKYLSGKVREKLEAAKLAASQDKFYEQNVTALEAVQPKDLNASQIYAPISASWIAPKYLNDFASDLFKQNISINRLSTGRVNVNGEDYNTQVIEEYGTSRMDGFKLLEEAIQNRMPIVKDTIDDGTSKKSVVNEIETQKAVEKAEKIKAQFDKWIWQDDERRNDLVNYYNQHFNNVVVRKYDGNHLTFDGYAGELKPMSHQLDGAWMIMQQMGGILDHIVGSGKTLLMVLTAQKMKEMGLIKKPIILGLKANTGDIADRYRKSFPLAKVLSPTEKDFTPDNRKAFFAKMANNDWDAIIMTHDQFGMITQAKEVQMEIIQQEIDALEDDIRAAKGNQMSKRDLNGLETRKNNLKAKLLSLTAMTKDKALKSFDDMGIDFMFVDESQMFKNLSYNTIQRGVAGLGNPLGSNKAFNMLVAMRTLQKMYGGDKGTVFASGTPISNTMVEMYLLFKYLRPNKMAEMGINSFDQWANTFARVGSEIEFGVTNSLKPKVRMRDFMNVPEMSAMYREIADVRNDSNLKLQKPEFKKTIRVKTDQNIPAFETVTIGDDKFKVIGRIKGIEKNEYWISLKSIGKDVKIPSSGKMKFGGDTINYSDTEYSDGLLINVVPTVEQRKFAKRIQKFAETKDGSWIGRPGLSEKEKKAYMLLATNLASKMAIDMRLVDPRYPSSEEGKIAVAADTILEHYKESSHLKGIQLVFSDLGTPKTGNTAENLFNLIESRGVDRETLETIFGSGAYADKPTFPPLKVLVERIRLALEYSEAEIEDAIKEANEDNFNVYQELKDKLVKRGIPPEEIVFIHDYKSDKHKKTLFSNARAGKVRVIIGSTSKLGTGVNVQEKIVAMHHLDVPWRPSDMEQRNGRGIRQGNKIIEEFYDNELPVYMYATESTLDAYKYQLLGTKQQFIDQAKTGDLDSREISEGDGDEETGISFSAMTAMLSGNPVILEKAKVDKKAKELQTSKKAFEQEKYSLKDKISKLKERIKYSKNRIEGLKKDKELFEKNAVRNEKSGEWEYEATIAGEKFMEKQEKTLEQIAEAEIVKKLGKEFKEPKVGSEYTFRDGEKVKIESTIDEPDGKKWQVRIKDKLQFLTTEQLKSNVTGEKKEKTVRQRVGDKIVELKSNYIKNARNTPEKIGTIYGFDVIMQRSKSDNKIVEIGVKSPVSDVVYYPTQSSDPLTIASHLQRQVRDLGDEIEATERTVAMAEEDVNGKTKYLETLPETFPKQAQLDETLAQQQRVTERLREMTTAVKLPTIEELESLGQRLYAPPSELELEDVYAITEDNVVLKINDKPELTDAINKNSRFYIYKEEQRGDDQAQGGEDDGGGGGGPTLGDTIRGAKIKLGGLQSNIAGIPIALYNAAIETIALAVDAGQTITQAIKKAIADHKLDKQKNFNRKEFIRAVEDASGEVFDENEGVTPKEIIAQDDKSILARMMKSNKVSDEVKEKLKASGLKYKIRTQKEARAAANGIIDEFGIDAAVGMAEGGRFHGDVNSMIFAVSLDKVFAEEQAAATPEDREAAAERWAGIAIRYQDAAESGGRFISAINDFYKKSPAGLVIKIEKEFQRRQDEYFEGREKPTKEAWEEFINTVEGKELLEEEIAKRQKQGRKIFSPESEKKIKSFFAKLRVDTKGTAGSYLLPPQLYNKAIDIIEGAVLGGLSIGKAIDQALDYINDNFKGTWQVKEFKKDIRDGFKNQNVQKVLSESDKEKILKKWERKLGGLNADERNSLLNKAFLELAENGALEYDDFKQMYAEAAGLPQMTPELQRQLIDLANKINEPDKIKEAILNTKDPALIKAYEKAIIEAEKAATTLNELIGKQKWWVNTFLTVMRLNTLGVVSLLGNIAYNVAALPVRFATNLTATGLDYLLAGVQLSADKIFGTSLYKHPPIHNVFGAQVGFVRGLKLGTVTAVKQFFTGLTNRDYFQREIRQNIKPLTSAKRLIRAMTGKEKLSLNETLNSIIEAFPTMGMSAEVIARALNVGDKPFRYAAEFAAAERLAQQKGLKGIDKEIFILFPDEESEKKIKDQGEKIVFQQKNVVTKMLDAAGNTVSNFVNELGWETKTLHGIGKTLGYATQPFLNTPLNVFSEFIHYAFPPLALYKAGKAMVKGDAERATYHLAQAVTGMSIAYAAGTLAANGLIAAAGGDDDEAKERRGIQTYQRQGQLNVSGLKRWLAGEPPTNEDGDIWIDLKYYGFVGMMMLAKAKQYKGKTKEQIEMDTYVQDMVGQFIPSVKIGLTEGVFSGTSSLINAMSMGGGYVDNWALGMGNVVVNAFEPQWLRQISLASNDYYRDPKGMTLPETAKNQLKQRFFMGDQLPARVNIWGDKVESVPNNTNPYLYNVLGLNKAAVFDNDRFGFVLYDYYNKTKDYNIFPPALRREVNGQSLTPQQFEEFSILVGSHRKQLVAPFIENGSFQEISAAEGGHDQLVKELSSIYEAGRNLAVREFVSIHPEFQKPEK